MIEANCRASGLIGWREQRERKEEKKKSPKKSKKGEETTVLTSRSLVFTAFIWARRHEANNYQREKPERGRRGPLIGGETAERKRSGFQLFSCITVT